MGNKDKHIDQFFRDKMDAHLEPLSADDRMLFEKSIAGSKVVAGSAVLKRIVKWLPYMSALSAAAAISYYGVVYRAEKSPEVVQVSPIVNTRTQQAPTVPLPIVADTQLSATGNKQFAVQQQATIIPKLYSLPSVAPVMNSAQYRYELLKTMMPMNKQMLASVQKRYPSAVVERQYNIPALPAPSDNANASASRRAQVSVHLGFESGLSKATYNAGMLGVQVKTKIANNLHIGAGANLRYATTPDIYVPQQQVVFDNYQRYVIITQGTMPGQYTYNYREKVDSTVIRYDVDKQFFDVELPVFVQYNLSKRFSLSAGIKFIYGSVAKINATSSRYSPMYTDTLRDISFFIDEEAAIGLFDKRCNCESDNITDYQNPTYNTIRTGYMLGAQYRPLNNVELGISLQQNATSLSNLPNPDVRKMYALPYFRLSVGYTFGSKK